jgi:hypothetical protein
MWVDAAGQGAGCDRHQANDLSDSAIAQFEKLSNFQQCEFWIKYCLPDPGLGRVVN